MTCEFTIEESRALVFFLGAWRYIGGGEKLRGYAYELSTAFDAESLPVDIIDEFNTRIYDSVTGRTTYAWIDRAVPGYKATLKNMMERRGMEIPDDDIKNDLADMTDEELSAIIEGDAPA